MPSLPRALACASLLAAAPAAALADHPPVVDTVIVTASPDPEDPPPVADARRRLSETPGAVAVVAAEAYESRYAPGLSEALRDAPGVYAQRKWGPDMRLSIRGSGVGNSSHNRGVLVAQDGVPFNEADGYGDLMAVDPAIARYVEVWKGGNALRFGGALLGGAINLVTPTGRDAQTGNVLRLDGGSWRTVRGHGEIARQFGDWDLFAAATAQSADGWRTHSAGEAQNLSFNVGRRFGEDREVRLILAGSQIEQEIPGSLTIAQALTTPRIAAPANLAGDYARNARTMRASLQTRWRLSPSTVFEGGAYAIWKDLDHPIFQVIDQESRNLGAFGRIDWTGQAGGLNADAFVGLWLRSGDLDAQNFANLAGTRGARLSASRQNAKAMDLFAEGRVFATPRLALVAGGSYGRAWRDYANVLNPTADRSTDYDWFAPRFGVLWQGEGGAQVFANLTRSVEPPNFSALVQTGVAGFVPLRAQEAWTAEAGMRGRRGPLVWDLSAYRADVRHELLNFIVSPSIPAASFNAGPTVHQGVEAGLDWRIVHTLRLRQTWTWSDFRFDGDRVYGDGRLPVIPESLYRAELRFEHAGWFVAPSLEWAPQGPWADYANTLKAPGYAVWSLNLGWTSPSGVKVFLDARNLTDEAYVSNLGAVTDARVAPAAAAWPGEGRSLFGGLAWRF